MKPGEYILWGGLTISLLLHFLGFYFVHRSIVGSQGLHNIDIERQQAYERRVEQAYSLIERQRILNRKTTDSIVITQFDARMALNELEVRMEIIEKLMGDTEGSSTNYFDMYEDR